MTSERQRQFTAEAPRTQGTATKAWSASRLARPLRFIALLLCLPFAGPAAAALPADGEFRVTLEDALRWKRERKTREPWANVQDFELTLRRRDARWDEPVWGFTEYLPAQEHLGRLIEAKTEGGAARLKIEMPIASNPHRPCVVGGEAVFTVRIAAGETGKLVGRFEAVTVSGNTPTNRAKLEEAWGLGRKPHAKPWRQPTLANRMIAFLKSARPSGTARVEVRDLPPRTGTPFDFAAGEHPRLLFTKDDLPRLRARAATPEGKRVMQRLEALLNKADRYGYGFGGDQAGHTMGPVWATGWGLLYQLTGEKKYASKAGRQFRGPMYGNYYYGGWWIHAYTVMGEAIAYDLCVDAWDEPTRNRVYAHLARNIRNLAARQAIGDPLGVQQRYRFANRQDEFEVRSPTHAKAAKFRAAAAIAALALLYDEPPRYEPTNPADAESIPPADDYDPWVGVPIVELESDKMFREWLVNGPFRRGTSDEYIAELGGWSDLRPEPGTRVEVDGETLDFRRYLPTGHDSWRGPTIYSRNCARYWTGATGGGYYPGRSLVRKWREDAGRRVATDVVLYTVLRNDAPRTIQALPNWRSRSEGNRMWINGREVRDGQIVRLEKGLYPIAVNVELMGGYSAMAPKLRVYTRKMHRRDLARLTEADRMFSGRGVFENEWQRDAVALQRSVRRYVERVVGPEGWGGSHAHETLLPLLHCWRNAAGENLAAGTGLEHLVPLAARMRGHMRTRPFDYMVSQSVPFAKPSHRGVAAWYLEERSLGIARPLDAVIALVSHDFEAKPERPSKRFRLPEDYDKHGIFAYPGGWGGDDAPFSMIETGVETAESIPLAAGKLRLQAFGRFWARPWWDSDADAYTELNNAAVRNLYPDAGGKVTHRSFREDGGGSVTMQIGPLRKVAYRDWKTFRLDHETDTGVYVRRSFAADYSGASGAEALFVTADRFIGSGRREKVWRMNVGRVYTDTAYNRRRPTLVIDEKHPRVLIRPKKTDATMWITFVVPPEGLELRTRRAQYKHSKDTMLEAKVDRHVGEIEKVNTGGLEHNLDRLEGALESSGAGRSGSDGDEDAKRRKKERKAAPASSPDPLDPAGDVPDLIAEDLAREQAKRDRKLPPVDILAVMTVQKGPEPEVAARRDGETVTITVGDQTIVYDGKKLTFKK